MKCRPKARDAHGRAQDGHDHPEPHDDDRHHAGTSVMALALFAGVVAGACLAQSWYHQRKVRERRDERRERIEQWEGEGGALSGSAGANPQSGA